MGTGRLNQALEAWIAHYRLPVRGKNYKIRFMTQVSSNPVRFVAFVNRMSGFPLAYGQYLENCIRRDLGFALVPVAVEFKQSRKTCAMRAWSIGEVARLLGVKPHVLRYWESELPLLSPKKGLTGRREYSANEVRLLMRFRHLLYDRKFTIEGAKRRMWEELGSADPDISARFARIRSDLIEALMTARRGSTAPHEGEAMAHGDVRDRIEGTRPGAPVRLLGEEAEEMRQRLARRPLVAGPGRRAGAAPVHRRTAAPAAVSRVRRGGRRRSGARAGALCASLGEQERCGGARGRRGGDPPGENGIPHRGWRAGIAAWGSKVPRACSPSRPCGSSRCLRCSPRSSWPPAAGTGRTSRGSS